MMDVHQDPTIKTTPKGTPEDELDYEVDDEDNDSKNNKFLDDGEIGEDGEVNSDDDLEEGEVKEDDSGDEDDGEVKDDVDSGPKKDGQLNQRKPNQTENVCKYFGKGTCTWGPQCRFMHQYPGNYCIYTFDFAMDSFILLI